MTLSPELILSVTLAYLGMLLLAAHVGDTFGWALRLSRQPFVVALSLGAPPALCVPARAAQRGTKRTSKSFGQSLPVI